MARQPRDARLETRDARARLKARKEPHWRHIHTGLALGYYKGTRSTAWLCRRPRAAGEPGTGRWKQLRLGTPDDHADADGLVVLSYAQAVQAALQQADAPTRIRQAQAAARDQYSVAACLDDYLEKLAATSRDPQATRYKLDGHVRPAFGDRPVAALTAAELEKWLHRLAKGRSPATANRIFRAFKAALNQAYRRGQVPSDAEWRKVQMFANADGRRTDYLTPAEAKRLLKVCAPDFQALVRAGLLTGARYGELIDCQVRDFDADAQTLRLYAHKTKSQRYVPLSAEATTWFETWTAGQPRTARIFTHADGAPWGRSQQIRRMQDASATAKLDRTVSFYTLRHTYGSLLARKGVPLKFIAEAMGHADTRMTERHYAHLQKDDAVGQAIRKNLPSFGKAGSKVRSLR